MLIVVIFERKYNECQEFNKWGRLPVFIFDAFRF